MDARVRLIPDRLLSVEIKIHPTHARNTKNIMVELGIFAISGWAIERSLGNTTKIQKL
jgi:hypothetical protein